MVSIYKENDKAFMFARKSVDGQIIKTVPQALCFTVKDETDSSLITKTIDYGITQNEDGTWMVMIEAADTTDIAVGMYTCDVKVKDESGREFTIVKPQTFKILDVATRRIG